MRDFIIIGNQAVNPDQIAHLDWNDDHSRVNCYLADGTQVAFTAEAAGEFLDQLIPKQKKKGK